MRDKKCRSLRGKVSHGYGRTNKHRKHSGGRGCAGFAGHMSTWINLNHPTYLGKVGDKKFHRHGNSEADRGISLSKIWSLIPKSQLQSILDDESVAPVIDVREFGYHVVIGGTPSICRPFVVKARYFTVAAEKSITAVGGRAIICS